MRKPKQAQAMLDKELSTKAILDVLAAAIDKGQPWAIMLYLSYRWGKPKPMAQHLPRCTVGVQVTKLVDGEPS